MAPDLAFAPAAVDVDRRADGTIYLRSPLVLGPRPASLAAWLVEWAERAPDRDLVAERAPDTGLPGGRGQAPVGPTAPRSGAAAASGNPPLAAAPDSWRRVTYGAALDAARAIGQALLDRGVSASRPLVVLADNSIDHALLMLGALYAGVPVVPVSPAYSLQSSDFAKLRHIVDLVRPGLVWTDDPGRFDAALAAIGAPPPPHMADLATTRPAGVDRAHRATGPDTVAKILFTSGSTGTPKGVVNTHGMLTANQQMLAQGWPFIERRPPVIVDWLPWNHTFGGNHNFNLILRNGGTLFVDDGKPLPGRIEMTARNLGEVSPTIYFNVPRGFDLLLPYLETDARLRANFFADLDAVFYAAAALPQHLWERLDALAALEPRGRPAMLSGWGATETSPLATQVHFPIARAGVIGLPVAGCELKLLPAAEKLEVRVKGPHVTPGYFRRPDLTAAAFDAEGFYRIGDAVAFADPAVPARGLVFDGRVAEDFKLLTGTWVSAGIVRVRFVAAGDPVIQDAVITGHDRDEVGALVFLSARGRELPPGEVADRIADALRRLAAEGGGGAARPTRAIIALDPLSIDAGEITDKGYINQGAVLARRAALVEALYADGPDVIRL